MKTCEGCLSNSVCEQEKYCIGLNRQWYLSKQRMVDAGLYDHFSEPLKSNALGGYTKSINYG